MITKSTYTRTHLRMVTALFTAPHGSKGTGQKNGATYPYIF